MTAPGWLSSALATVEVADSAGERSLTDDEAAAIARAVLEHIPTDELAEALPDDELERVLRTLDVAADPLESRRRRLSDADEARVRAENAQGTAEYLVRQVAEARDRLADQLSSVHRYLDEISAPTTADGRALEPVERVRVVGDRCLALEDELRLKLSLADQALRDERELRDRAVGKTCAMLSLHVSPTQPITSLDLALDLVDEAFRNLRSEVLTLRVEGERHRGAAEHAEAMRRVGEKFAEQTRARRERVVRNLRGEVKGLRGALSAAESERDLALRAKRNLQHLPNQLLETDRQRAAASTMRDQATSQLSALRRERDEASAAFKRSSREADRLSGKLAKAVERQDRLRKTVADLQFERDDARSLADALEVDLTALEDTVRELCDED